MLPIAILLLFGNILVKFQLEMMEQIKNVNINWNRFLRNFRISLLRTNLISVVLPETLITYPNEALSSAKWLIFEMLIWSSSFVFQFWQYSGISPEFLPILESIDWQWTNQTFKLQYWKCQFSHLTKSHMYILLQLNLKKTIIIHRPWNVFRRVVFN